jgi:hypothetical protein
MAPTAWLAAFASVVHIAAYGIYSRQILAGAVRPNAASWAVWSFVTVLNFTSYRSMSGDWVKALLPTAGGLACILTFVVALFAGTARRLDSFDKTALALGLVASLAWWQFDSATYANLILQLCIAIGFVPTYRGLWDNPRNELPLCWRMWTLAYLLTIAVVILRWNGQYQDLAYPILSFLLHGGVAIMAGRAVKPAVQFA